MKKCCKILSVLIAMMMLLQIVSVTYASNIEKSEATIDDSYLVSVDLETGEETRIEYPNEEYINNYEQIIQENSSKMYIPEDGGISSQGIIPPTDDRVPIFFTDRLPYSAICKINVKFPDGTTGDGTGFMIYKNLLLTAGHCVRDIQHGGSASRVTVYPGQNGNGVYPYGSTNAVQLLLDGKYINGEDSSEDWALVFLGSNIGDKSNWLGIAYSEDYTYFQNGESVTLVGYPGDKTDGRQYSSTGKVEKAAPLYLLYKADAAHGQSGSPVFDKAGYAIAIHSGGQTLVNKGINITKQRFNTFVSYMK